MIYETRYTIRYACECSNVLNSRLWMCSISNYKKTMCQVSQNGTIQHRRCGSKSLSQHLRPSQTWLLRFSLEKNNYLTSYSRKIQNPLKKRKIISNNLRNHQLCVLSGSEGLKRLDHRMDHNFQKNDTHQNRYNPNLCRRRSLRTVRK